MGCPGGVCGIKRSATKVQGGGSSLVGLSPEALARVNEDIAARAGGGQPAPAPQAQQAPQAQAPLAALQQAVPQQYADQIAQLQAQIAALQQGQNLNVYPANVPNPNIIQQAGGQPPVQQPAPIQQQAPAPQPIPQQIDLTNQQFRQTPGVFRSATGGPVTNNRYRRMMHALPTGHPTRRFMESAQNNYPYAAPSWTTGTGNPPGVPLAPDTGPFGRVVHAAGGVGPFGAILTAAAPLIAAGATGALGALAGGGAGAGTAATAGGGAALGGGAGAIPAAVGGGILGGMGPLLGAGALGLGAGAALGGGGGGGNPEQEGFQNDIRAGRGVRQFPRFTPQQEAIMNQLMQMGMDEATAAQQAQAYDFDPIANEARRGFHEETVPSIAARFTGMGGAGGQRSGAFARTLGQAGATLESQLAAQRAKFGLQSQAVRQSGLQNLLGHGLEPRFDTFYPQPAAPRPSAREQIMGGIGNTLPYAAAALMQGVFR